AGPGNAQISGGAFWRHSVATRMDLASMFGVNNKGACNACQVTPTGVEKLTLEECVISCAKKWGRQDRVGLRSGISHRRAVISLCSPVVTAKEVPGSGGGSACGATLAAAAS